MRTCKKKEHLLKRIIEAPESGFKVMPGRSTTLKAWLSASKVPNRR